MSKRICVLSTKTPFMSSSAEMLANALVAQLRLCGFEAELIELPFKWYPCASLQDSMLMWRLLDLSEANGKTIDLVIATKFPTYYAGHPNMTLWLMCQHRPAYDLYDDRNYAGMLHVPYGPETKRQIEMADNEFISRIDLRYAISKNVSKRLLEYNGIQSEPLYHPPALADRYLSGEYGDYILSVGRLDRIKHNELLLKAMVHCDRRIQAKIIGKGTELESLQELAKKLGISDKVDFLGFIPDNELPVLYTGAFAVFFAPIDEDYGYSTLEAFLSRKPVITCADSSGVLEFVRDGETGCVCETAPQAIGDAINRLYADKALCARLGTAGYETVKDINWDNVVDKLTQTL